MNGATSGDGARESVSPDPVLVEQISGRLAAISGRIAERTDRAVEIVCVTKGHPAAVVASAFAAGCTTFGESYAQELVAKAELLESGSPSTTPQWHFIGRLQSNKVRAVAGLVEVWQTVDRSSLAREIAKRAPGARVLVQLDLAGLPGRGGCDPADTASLVETCTELGLEVTGLMGVAVPGTPDDARPGFRRLVGLADELGLPDRSIGMSGDYEVAVEEGATIVRIGSALVGERT